MTEQPTDGLQEPQRRVYIINTWASAAAKVNLPRPVIEFTEDGFKVFLGRGRTVIRYRFGPFLSWKEVKE